MKQSTQAILIIIFVITSLLLNALFATRKKAQPAMPHMTNALTLDTNATGFDAMQEGITNLSRTAFRAGFIVGWEACSQGVTFDEYRALLQEIDTNSIYNMVRILQRK